MVGFYFKNAARLNAPLELACGACRAEVKAMELSPPQGNIFNQKSSLNTQIK